MVRRSAGEINNKLEINAAGVDSTISNSLDGVTKIGGGFASEMTINLSDPADHWAMAGEMNLASPNFVPFSVNRAAGSSMRLTGQLNVFERVGISAPTTFDNPSETNLLTADDRLTLTGKSVVRPGATFNGVGTLLNNASAGLTLQEGVSLNFFGLVNDGLDLILSIGMFLSLVSFSKAKSSQR